jgi:hypothetical protein
VPEVLGVRRLEAGDLQEPVCSPPLPAPRYRGMTVGAWEWQPPGGPAEDVLEGEVPDLDLVANGYFRGGHYVSGTGTVARPSINVGDESTVGRRMELSR